MVVYDATHDAVSDKAVGKCAELTRFRLSFEVGDVLVDRFADLLISCIENESFPRRPSDVFPRVAIGFKLGRDHVHLVFVSVTVPRERVIDFQCFLTGHVEQRRRLYFLVFLAEASSRRK